LGRADLRPLEKDAEKISKDFHRRTAFSAGNTREQRSQVLDSNAIAAPWRLGISFLNAFWQFIIQFHDESLAKACCYFLCN
jgi:hypothetical protein